MLVEKVNYQIDWAKFSVGSSFFIPCLNPVKARDEILPVLRRLKYEVVHKVVIEDGVQGIRVWRVTPAGTPKAATLGKLTGRTAY